MKFKRLIAFVSAMSIMASTMVGVSASNEGNEVLSAWGNSSITLGKDFGIVTKSDGNCYISNEDYNNVNFNRTFNTGKTVKVAVPNDLDINESYALVLRESGEVVGFNFNKNDLSAHSTQINSVRVTEGAVDVLANDTKAVALMADGTVRFTQNENKNSVNISYYEDVSVEDEVYQEVVNIDIYEPDEELENWSNITKIDLELDYVLGVTNTGEVKMSNSNNKTGQVIDEEISYSIPQVYWVNDWSNSNYPEDMDSVKQEVETLTDIRDVDGTDDFVAYVKNDGTCGIAGGSLYMLDEVYEWQNIKDIRAVSNGYEALIVGVTEDGKVKTTRYGYSVLLDGEDTEVLEKINSLGNVKSVEIVETNSGYILSIMTTDLKFDIIKIDGYDEWADNITGLVGDIEIPIDKTVNIVNGLWTVDFNIDNSYETYTLYMKKSDDEQIEINDDYKKTRFTLDRNNNDFDYIVTKLVNGVEVASVVKKVNISNANMGIDVMSVPESGVVNKHCEIKLSAVHNNNVIENAIIKYIKVGEQADSLAASVAGKTISDVRADDKLNSLIDTNSIQEYEGSITIDSSCSILAWAEDSAGLESHITYLKYTTLMERPNSYPKEIYASVYDEKEREDIINGYRVPRRNTMMVKAGSYMSAALATNGEVWSSRIGTIYEDGMDIPVNYTSSPSSDPDSTDWLATRMWRMISDIAVGESHVAGLRIDGTVVASGNNEKSQCNVSEWKDIVDIAAGKDHTVGLTKTGEVIGTTSSQGDTEDYGQTEFNTWMYKYNDSLTEEENKALEKEQRIVAIEANNNNTIGLRNNGTVVVAGNNDSGQCNTDTWTDIIDIAMGTRHAVGLKSDGTVVATGDNGYGQCNVGSWKNVVQISASAYETVGLTYSGEVLRAGANAEGTIAIYGAQTKLNQMQNKLTPFIVMRDSEGNYPMSSSNQVNFVVYGSGDNQETSSISSIEYRIDVYDKISEMYEKGIRFASISSGNYVTILVDTSGIVYNILHSVGPNEPSDSDYPIIKIDNEYFNPTLDRGPTIINNYSNGVYNKELDIKLSSTTGEENNIMWSLDNTDVYAMGTNSNNLTFEGANILNVAPYSYVGSTKVNHPEIKYFYNLANPTINFSKTGSVLAGTQVIITNSRPSKYKIYYTTDGTDPYFEYDYVSETYKPDSTTIEYTAGITISDDTIIRAKAYNIDYIESDPENYATDVFEAVYTVGDAGEDTGTIVENSRIDTDTIFTRQGSPYTIVNNLTVASGATLSIEPGVTIKVADNKGIVVNGNLVSYGTQEEPVMFTSDTKWNGIQLNSQSGNNESVIKNIDVNNASTALSINTEATRIVDGIQYISLHNNDNGLSVQSDGIIVSHIMTYDNKNGYGIAVNADDVTVDNCHIAGNSIGVNVNGFNCNITYCNITNNANYGIFLDGGADHYMSKIVVNYNTIDSNYSINKETGEKIGYNVGCTDATYLYSMEVNFLYNYWGNPLKAEILKTLPPSDKSPVFIFEDRRYDPVYHDSIDINTEYISDTEEVVSSITDASKAIVNVKRTGGAAYKLPLIIVGYNETGEMVTMQIIDGIIPADDSGTYEVDLNEATELKVLIWESLDSMKPLL